jgi:hypothetical protein
MKIGPYENRSLFALKLLMRQTGFIRDCSLSLRVPYTWCGLVEHLVLSVSPFLSIAGSCGLVHGSLNSSKRISIDYSSRI